MEGHVEPLLSINWDEAPFAVVDVESNGQTPAELIELGIVAIDRGCAGQLMSWFVRPTRSVRKRVSEVHGIHDADLMGAPRIEEVRGIILSALQGRYLVAHNAGVDWAILHRAVPDLEPLGVIDTLRLARALVPGLASYRLVDLLDAHGVACAQLGPAHRAAHDSYGAAQLFLHLMERHASHPMALRELLSLGRLRTIHELSQRELF